MCLLLGVVDGAYEEIRKDNISCGKHCARNLPSVGSEGVVSASHSNSQNEVVVEKAPANRIAALPDGLSSSSKKIILSASISPRVRSS